jgi:hypothetical protein
MEVNFETLCRGTLARDFYQQFEEASKVVLARGKPVTINIKLVLKPVEELDSMFTTHGKVTSSPPPLEHDGICQSINGRLVVEEERNQMNLPFNVGMDNALVIPLSVNTSNLE